MKTEVKITRTQAALLIDRLRTAIAEQRKRTERGGFADTAVVVMEQILNDAGVPSLQPCLGEAHSNAYIDNCMCCAPRWGWVGPTVKVT